MKTPPEEGRNPAWFDQLLEYEDRPLSKKLAIGVAVGVTVSLLVFGATLLLYRPVTGKVAPAPAAPAADVR